jgi:hypothetical protein
MAKFEGTLTVQTENGDEVIASVKLEINEEVSQEIKIDYLSANDGGPLMRPSKPPRG